MSDKVLLAMEDGIAVLTLNRPQAFNSFDLELLQALAAHTQSLAADPAVTGIVLTGTGKAFSTGGDLKYVHAYGDNYAAFHVLAGYFHQAILEIRGMAKPVIAAVNGVAAGGGFSLALACDFRVMAHSATLLQAYSSSGLSMDGGGTFVLPRIVGLARALEIAAFDPPIPAAQALDWGLVTEVVADGQSLARARDILKDMQRRSLSSFGAYKRLFNASFDQGLERTLEQERELLGRCGERADGREGIAAFVEKRRPVFGRGPRA